SPRTGRRGRKREAGASVRAPNVRVEPRHEAPSVRAYCWASACRQIANRGWRTEFPFDLSWPPRELVPDCRSAGCVRTAPVLRVVRSPRGQLTPPVNKSLHADSGAIRSYWHQAVRRRTTWTYQARFRRMEDSAGIRFRVGYL